MLCLTLNKSGQSPLGDSSPHCGGLRKDLVSSNCPFHLQADPGLGCLIALRVEFFPIYGLY